MTKKLGWLVGGAALMMVAAPAQAQEPEGKFQVKLLGTAVVPDGKITSVKADPTNVTVGAQSDAKNNVVPTLAVEYFFSPNLSVETICCLTTHHINGEGTLAGTELMKDIMILPATVTLKAHLPLGPIKPYVGAGPTYFLFLGDKSGATTQSLGLTKGHVDDTFGAVLQAGVDVPLGAKGFGLSLDAKRYFVRPKAYWYDATGALGLATKHKLDPWVLSAGVSYRF